MMKVAWDVSHSEFAVKDHYYYSKLMEYAAKEGLNIEEIDDLRVIDEYDVLVINYPEEKFSDNEARIVEAFVKRGGILIVLAYYENKDDSARASTSLSKNFGVKFNEDKITSESSGDNEYIIITSKVKKFNRDVERVLIPCPCSVNGGNYFVFEEKKEIPIFSYIRCGKGIAVFGGSCAFWDNHSIDRESNKNFSMNLLKGLV